MITLDITGFYYRYATSPGGIYSVFDLMNSAQGVRVQNGGVLSFQQDPNGFVDTITVDYDDNSQPVSRQSGEPRQKTKYSFTDNVRSPVNRISVPGSSTGLLVWQYYITDERGTLKSGADAQGIRTIVPFTLSDQPPGAPLVDGDTVTWRLVAIFGVADLIDQNKDRLAKINEGGPLSLKAALRALR